MAPNCLPIFWGYQEIGTNALYLKKKHLSFQIMLNANTVKKAVMSKWLLFFST